MSEERKRILEMLARGKIKVDEAERLLNAIGEDESPQAATVRRKLPKYLRVLVEPAESNPAGDRVNVRVPFNLIRAGMKWMSFIPANAQNQVESAFKEKGIDMDLSRMKPEDLEEILVHLDDLQVEVDGKEKVRVFCE